MRAIRKVLKLPRLSQSNAHAPNGGGDWCGRTSASMIYNYFRQVATHGTAENIVNQYTAEPYDLVYPDKQTRAALVDGNYKTLEPLARHRGPESDWELVHIFPMSERAAGPVLETDRDRIDAAFARILDHADQNNPTIIGTGLTNGWDRIPTHFVVVSGYRYDERGDLWLLINDPATTWTLIKKVSESRRTTKYAMKDGHWKGDDVEVLNEGLWARKGDFEAKPEGSLYWLRAWFLLSPNPTMQGAPAWQGHEAPGGALFIDNHYMCNPAVFPAAGPPTKGGSARINPKLFTPDSEYSETEYAVSWPIDPAAKGDAANDWKGWAHERAPYPIGGNLHWHGGVHVVRPAAKSDRVYSFAPGQIVRVRAPGPPSDADAPRADDGDVGFVLVRHRFDRDKRAILARPSGDDAKARYERAPAFYSLYMHLAPITRFLDAETRVPKDDAPGWLRALGPQPVPAPRKFVKRGSPIWYATRHPTACGELTAVPLLTVHQLEADCDQTFVDGKERIGGFEPTVVSLEGARRYALPRPALAAPAIAACLDRGFVPTLGAEAQLHYFNPLTGEVFPVQGVKAPGTERLLELQGSVEGRPYPRLEVLGPPGTAGRKFVAIASHATPGFDESELNHRHHLASNVVDLRDVASVTLSIDGPGDAPPHAEALAGDAPRRFLSARALPEDRAQMSEVVPELHACVAFPAAEFDQLVASLRAPPRRGVAPAQAVVPSDRPLQLFDPLSERVIPTSAPVPAGAALVRDGRSLHVEFRDDAQVYVAVAGYEARIGVAEADRARVVVAQGAGAIFFDPTVKEVVIHTDTQDEAHGFAGAKGSTARVRNADALLAFQVTARAPSGPRAGASARMRVELRPCVPVPDARVEDLERRMQEADRRSRLSDTRARLAAGTSFLLGVELSEKAGWEYADGVVRIRADHLGMLGGMFWNFVFFSEVKLEKDQLQLAKIKAGTSEAPWAVMAIAPFAFEPAGVFYGDKPDAPTIALVEFIATIPTEIADNSAEIAARNAANDAARQRIEAIARGEATDVEPDKVFVSREFVGAMGQVVTDLSCGEGFHFEIFSAENLVDAGATGEADRVVPVPNSNWWVYRQSAAFEFTPDFVTRAYDALVASPAFRASPAALPDVAHETRVIARNEWIAFCKSHALALSQVITAHGSEWVDGRSGLLRDRRATHLSDGARDAKTSALDALAALPAGGLSCGANPDEMFFYHPLRFVEWLITGVDIETSGVADPKLKITVGAGRPIPLSPEQTVAIAKQSDPGTRNFRFRTVVGERATAAGAVLELEGFDTPTTRIPITIQRAGLRQLRIVQPCLRAAQADVSATAPTLRVPAKLRGAPLGFVLLADDAAPLPSAALGRVTVRFEAVYNVLPPERIAISLSDASAFRVVGCRASDPTSTATFSADGARVTVPRPTSTQSFQGARSIGVEVDVVARRGTNGKAHLTASATGGDMPAGARPATSAVLTTRVIKAATPIKKNAKTPKSPDVARLQLYLAQIPAHDGLPCFRAPKAVSARRPDAPAARPYDIDVGAVPEVGIDGGYGVDLARALWRFAYTWASDTLKPFDVPSLAFTDQAGADKGSVPLAELKSPPAPPAPAPGQRPTPRDADVRMSEQCADYPVVDRALLDEILERFTAPYVLPVVRVTARDFSLPVDAYTRGYAVAPVKAPWNSTDVGRTAILPIDGDSIQLEVSCPESGLVGESVDLVVALPGTSAYAIVSDDAGGDGKNLRITRADTSRVITLKFSGRFTTTAADNLLTVTSKGGVALAQFQLAGVREGLVAGAAARRDAALLQLLLSQLRDRASKQDQPFLKRWVGKGSRVANLVDGKWDDRSVAAFEGFKKHVRSSIDPSAAATFKDAVLWLQRTHETEPPRLVAAP